MWTSGFARAAVLVVDGRGFKLQGYENGNFLGGCLFDQVSPDMTIYKDEIFGPVLATIPFDDVEQVAELANQNIYGLAAAKLAEFLPKDDHRGQGQEG